MTDACSTIEDDPGDARPDAGVAEGRGRQRVHGGLRREFDVSLAWKN